MSASNVVHPEGAPVTSQPSSRSGSAKSNERDEDENAGLALPTPSNFITPKDCPAGLEALVEPEYIFMKQSFCSIEGMGIENHREDAAKYEVLTVFGQRIFVGVEKKEVAMSNMFCTSASPFTISVFSKTSSSQQQTGPVVSEKFKKEVLTISGHSGSFMNGAEIDIKYEKKKLGRVEHESDFSILRYTVQNAEGKNVLRIVGPKYGSCCNMSVGKVVIHEFDIFLADGHTHVGRIAKHWSGVPNTKDVFSRCDIWGVKFPKEYDVKLKSLLMSTCFLMVLGHSSLAEPPGP